MARSLSHLLVRGTLYVHCVPSYRFSRISMVSRKHRILSFADLSWMKMRPELTAYRYEVNKEIFAPVVLCWVLIRFLLASYFAIRYWHPDAKCFTRISHFSQPVHRFSVCTIIQFKTFIFFFIICFCWFQCIFSTIAKTEIENSNAKKNRQRPRIFSRQFDIMIAHRIPNPLLTYHAMRWEKVKTLQARTRMQFNHFIKVHSCMCRATFLCTHDYCMKTLVR